MKSLRSDHTKALAQDWEDAYELWKVEILNEPKYKPTSKYIIIKGLCYVIRKLVNFGVLPKVVLTPPSAKLTKSSKPTKTVADLSRRESSIGSSDQHEGSRFEGEEANHESNGRASFSADFGAGVGVDDLSDKEQATVYLRINAERLTAIRSHATEEFVKWHDHWLMGQRLLTSSDMSFQEIKARLPGRHSGSRNKAKALGSLFPADQPEVSLSRLLTYISYQQESNVAEERFISEAPFWLRAISKRYGGIEKVHAYLYPSERLTVSTVTLFLCDTGANVSVARTLPPDCLEDTDEANYKRVRGVKMRAGGKLIVDELPVKDPCHRLSCVEAIQTYQKISEPLRSLVVDVTRNSLFLCADHYGTVRPITPQALRQSFMRFCERHDDLRGLGIQPSMIRPSLLLQTTIDKEGGIMVASALGEHKFLSTTFGYVSRLASRRIWELKIREFQSLFQAISIHSIQGAAKKIGLSTEEVERLFNQAHRTGLGVVCINPKEGIQPDSVQGQTCTQLQNCPTCPNVLIVSTEQNLTELILWNRHLEMSRPDWEVNRPERWESVWLPWLVFTQVAIEQASRGRAVKTFIAAKALAETVISEAKLNLPPLW